MQEASEMGAHKPTVLVVNDEPSAAQVAAVAEAIGAPPVVKVGEDAVGVEMTKLELKPGDVLLVKIPTTMPTSFHERMKSAARAWLNSQGLERCRLLIIEGGIDMAAVDAQYMERCGWIRKS